MLFDHDNMTGVHLAAGLVNAVGREPGAPSVGDVEAVLREHSIRGAGMTAAQRDRLVEWSDGLRRVFAARDWDERAAAANVLLASGTAGAYLTTHDDSRPHLHFAPEEEDVVARVSAITAGGIAIFLVESDGMRLGVCARATCETVFVDTSRNGRRAYCSARCGNNDAVGRRRSPARHG